MNQKINSILLSSRWRSKSCSTIPPSNIYHSPAVGFFRPIPSSLVNSSSLIPKTRPNRSVRKSVIRTCSVLLKEHGLSSEPIVNGRNVARTGSRRRFPTLGSSDLGHIRDAPTRSARNSFGCTSRRYFRKLVEHKTLSRRLREVSHSDRKKGYKREVRNKNSLLQKVSRRDSIRYIPQHPNDFMLHFLRLFLLSALESRRKTPFNPRVAYRPSRSHKST